MSFLQSFLTHLDKGPVEAIIEKVALEAGTPSSAIPKDLVEKLLGFSQTPALLQKAEELALMIDKVKENLSVELIQFSVCSFIH